MREMLESWGRKGVATPQVLGPLPPKRPPRPIQGTRARPCRSVLRINLAGGQLGDQGAFGGVTESKSPCKQTPLRGDGPWDRLTFLPPPHPCLALGSAATGERGYETS